MITKKFAKVLVITIFVLLLATVILGALPKQVYAVTFTVGDVVQVQNVNPTGLAVRGPNACDPIIGREEYDGTQGYVTGGMVPCDGYNRWKVHWANEVLKGWSPEGYPGGLDYLRKVTVSPSTKFSIGSYAKVQNANPDGLKIRTDPPDLAYTGTKVYDGERGSVIATGIRRSPGHNWLLSLLENRLW